MSSICRNAPPAAGQTPAVPLCPAPERALFISPHLDDAAFSCGCLIASLPEPVVATVFAGKPPAGGGLTAWDRAAGFAGGDEAVDRRRDEDRQALAVLGGWPLWLDFLDRQYGPEPPLDDLAAELHRLLRQCAADAVFFPLGLFHSDHLLTRRAAVVFARCCAGCAWFAYEEALYRCLPDWRQAAFADLEANGLSVRPASFASSEEAALRKREAVACYRSQLRALNGPRGPGTDDLDGLERYWRVVPRGAVAASARQAS